MIVFVSRPSESICFKITIDKTAGEYIDEMMALEAEVY